MMGEHSSVLRQPSNISFLLQYLGGHTQLDEAIVGVGNGLEEVGNDGNWGKLSCFATTKQHKLSYTWEATRSSMSPLLGWQWPRRDSAMMGNTPLFCNQAI